MACEKKPNQPKSEADGENPAPLATQQMLLIEGVIVALALFLRLLWLGMKPPHHDEGVNGWFIDQIRENGYFQYDPSNYHGPFHFYVLFLMQTLFGRSIEALRLPLVLINAATVWLVLQFRRFIPWRTCVFAALAFAVSPGMVFYSRYAIHEPWVVFGMILAVWGMAEMWMHGKELGLWAALMGITLMILNKETHIIHIAAFGLAVLTLAGLEMFSPSSKTSILPLRPAAQQWRWSSLFTAFSVSLLLIVIFYSGVFQTPLPGTVLAKNFFQAFAIWSNTGVHGKDHAKEWYYWIQLLLRYEWPALLGLIWCMRAAFPGMDRLTRYLAIYGCGVFVAYSKVPYKTPWCIISIIWPFFFLFGSGVDSAMRFLEKGKSSILIKRLPGAAALALLAASLASTVDLNFFHPTDPAEFPIANLVPAMKENKAMRWLSSISLPTYVYVQTTNDYFKFTRPLEALLAVDPSAVHMTGNIMLSSYHPLPWTLGDFQNVGYYDQTSPSTMDADFIIAEDDRIPKLEPELKQSYFVFPFKLRDAMNDGKLYLNAARFARVINRKPDFEPITKPAP